MNSSNFGASSSESYNGWRHLRQHRRTSPICSITTHIPITKLLILTLLGRMLYTIFHIHKYDNLVPVCNWSYVPDHRVSSQYTSDSCRRETFLGSSSSTRQFLLYRLHESQPVSPYQIHIHCTSSTCMLLGQRQFSKQQYHILLTCPFDVIKLTVTETWFNHA